MDKTIKYKTGGYGAAQIKSVEIDRETIAYARTAYSFLFSGWDRVSNALLADEIESTHCMNEPRNAEVVRVLRRYPDRVGDKS